MNKLKDNKGMSRLEVICITGIVLVAIFFILVAGGFYKGFMNKGDDALKVNACESVARNNVASNQCVVNDCDGGGNCKHINGDGYSVGYYDAVTHHIEGEKMSGYNEYTALTIGDITYKGERNTMVIKVYGKADEIKMEWVEGDN